MKRLLMAGMQRFKFLRRRVGSQEIPNNPNIWTCRCVVSSGTAQGREEGNRITKTLFIGFSSPIP